MHLNPIWDVMFSLIIIGKCWWYWWEGPQRIGISRIRQILFYLALAWAFVIMVGPVPHLAVQYFWVHMVQHISLMMVISPLLVLGSPVKLARNSRSSLLRGMVSRLSRVIPIRWLFHPTVGFVLFLATLFATHFSPLANLGMRNSNVHSLELVLFLVVGFIYYFAVMDGNPHPYFVPYSVRVGSLFAMMLPETMTGFFLYSGNHLLHDVTVKSGISPIDDQHLGGALMWSAGMIIDSIWIALAAREWFANEKRLADDGE